MRIGLILLLALSAGTVASQTPAPATAASAVQPAQLDRVTVSGGPTANSRRRNSTASKIVIDREDLSRYGDTMLGDVLRRLPGVTLGGRPGRGGDIRLRGMGSGFTQILIDGERIAARLQRSSSCRPNRWSASRSCALLRRRPAPAPSPAPSTSSCASRWPRPHRKGGPASAATTANRRPTSIGRATPRWFDDALAGTLSVNGNLFRRWNDIDTEYRSVRIDTGAQTGESSQLGQSLSRGGGLNANARLRWKLSEQQQIWLSPVAFLNRSRSGTRIDVRGNSRYDQAVGETESTSAMLRLGASYAWRPSPLSRWELRGGIGRTRFDSDNQRIETRQGQAVRSQHDQSDTRDDNASLGGKWSLQTAREHQWVSGWEAERGERVQTRTTRENGLPKPGLEEFGDTLAARTRRLAAYTQDEWSPNKAWSVYAGLRWEQMATTGDAGGVMPSSTTTSAVWSPLFHLLWKPADWPKDQVRLSLTRSYRAPGLNDLIAKPVVNASYPNGANPQTHADSAGNPGLRPELATGVDLSLEHWLSSGGVLMVSAYVREIDGLIRRLLQQETVPWDSSPRWVSRPRNLDKARTMGIELEAKARLDELWEDAPDAWAGLLLRANLALFASKVDGIPGPHNRLDQQPRGTLNLGADYLWPQGVRSGVNWGYVPVTTVQQTPLLLRRDNARRVLDAYLQWSTGDPRDGITWRLSFANLLPADTVVFTQVDNLNSRSTTDDRKRTFANWNLRAEMRF